MNQKIKEKYKNISKEKVEKFCKKQGGGSRIMKAFLEPKSFTRIEHLGNSRVHVYEPHSDVEKEFLWAIHIVEQKNFYYLFNRIKIEDMKTKSVREKIRNREEIKNFYKKT